MGQAITTKILGPTNCRLFKRIRVKCLAKNIIVGWSDNLNIEDNHKQAARVLAASLGWEKYGQMFSAGLPDGNSYCHVIISKNDLIMAGLGR